ncbi:MAG: hypothetical protein WBO08_17860 [Mycobacterium sp.]|nr:hypothetical protein [Mycobacterium sp.]
MAAIAAITGQSMAGATELFCTIAESAPDDTQASAEDIGGAVNRMCTRVGLAPALDQLERDTHIHALRALTAGDASTITLGDLRAWDTILRATPEKVPTVEREPVVLTPMPEHQAAMWLTLLDFEETDPPPWVLVGGQMTALHLAEHGVTEHRPTDDGDMVVGVWTRRDALRSTAIYLTDNDFTESPTEDGFGYRFTRGRTVIDVMIPEGLDRQQRYPTTSTGRRGLSAGGGNQALTRAERVPVNVGGRVGYVRRPNLLGALVAKAHARIVDSRDPERHSQDLVALAGVALLDPRAVVSQARPDDRRAIRSALRHLPAGHRLLRLAEDPGGVHAFLTRLGQSPG